MQSTDIKTELLVNHDFAKGTLEGWKVGDPSAFTVMKDPDGQGFICVLKVQPGEGVAYSLEQTDLPAIPGTYYFSHWYRISDESGQPADGTATVTGSVGFAADGVWKVIAKPASANREWKKLTKKFELPANATSFTFSIQHTESENTTGWAAIRNVSLWRM
ncbi:carbohydrate binding domain-containing protein [Pseudomonas sp. Marseille-P9899]|uniref:carbohydrate binding domain-containing protein n=1 Tax=Pseudomonas sp. Marseille-P9899 TaxID=2730401 RepID=UPI00158BD095|nr:carbohydrate binding domain-containing protein [Pseudomonas sp. Marseille-P9899]